MSEIELRDDDLLAEVVTRIEEDASYLVPLTGEVVDLLRPAQVAAALDAVREAKRTLEDARAFLELVLRAEGMRQGTKTLLLEEGWKAEISGGSRPIIDDPELLTAELEDAGLPPERIAAAIRQVVSWEVRHGELDRIAKANARYAELIERRRRREPRAWRVDVKRTGGGPE
jgi:hypothetical protein